MLNYRPSLIVGSVFVPHERSKRWYEMQIQFLRKTCPRFRHVVFVNGKMDHGIFEHSEVIGDTLNFSHSEGLSGLVDYFRSNPSDSYLFLDSDCFPILDNWNKVLLSKMGGFKFAAPIRYENLDVFAHPCALFIKGEHIHEDWLDFEGARSLNLLNKPCFDVGCRLPMGDCFPLLRSNFYNMHPIFAAVYNHMFYHHGCGSRKVTVRAIGQGYFDHYMLRNEHEQCFIDLFSKLDSDPLDFIDILTKRKIPE